jgi:hypothetical protein
MQDALPLELWGKKAATVSQELMVRLFMFAGVGEI